MKKGLLDMITPTQPSNIEIDIKVEPYDFNSSQDDQNLSKNNAENILEEEMSFDEKLIPIIVRAYIDSYQDGDIKFEPMIKGLALFLEDYEARELDDHDLDAYRRDIMYEAITEVTTLKPKPRSLSSPRYKVGEILPSFKKATPTIVDMVLKKHPNLSFTSKNRGGNDEVFELAAEKLREFGFFLATYTTVRDAFYQYREE